MSGLAAVSAAILGCSGPVLTAAERRFFATVQPLGFILFARNIVTPDQVRSLTADLREAVEREDAPILIDQEGGRVRRLRPPHWRDVLAPGLFGAMAASDSKKAQRAVFLNHRLIAAELIDLGIDVDCAPLVDLRFPGAHDIIGDRAFGPDPELVADLGREAARGLMEGGVTPIIKHVPGHGRALVDSHLDLPRVGASHAELRRMDFAPFIRLADLPWAMTAHVIFDSIDPNHPASLSERVIGEVIRQEIGFDGLLLCDDLSMKALMGDLTSVTRDCLRAGCDVGLHCNGNLDEMHDVVDGVGALSAEAGRRYRRGRNMVGRAKACEIALLKNELDRLCA